MEFQRVVLILVLVLAPQTNDAKGLAIHNTKRAIRLVAGVPAISATVIQAIQASSAVGDVTDDVIHQQPQDEEYVDNLQEFGSSMENEAVNLKKFSLDQCSSLLLRCLNSPSTFTSKVHCIYRTHFKCSDIAYQTIVHKLTTDLQPNTTKLEKKFKYLLHRFKNHLNVFKMLKTLDGHALNAVETLNTRVNKIAGVSVYDTYSSIVDKLASTFHKLRTNMIILLP